MADYNTIRFFCGDDIELCYTHEISDKALQKVLDSGKDFVIDLQNLTDERKKHIEANNYALRVAGYQLTGNNDLFQYYFTKIKK